MAQSSRSKSQSDAQRGEPPRSLGMTGRAAWLRTMASMDTDSHRRGYNTSVRMFPSYAVALDMFVAVSAVPIFASPNPAFAMDFTTAMDELRRIGVVGDTHSGIITFTTTPESATAMILNGFVSADFAWPDQ